MPIGADEAIDVLPAVPDALPQFLGDGHGGTFFVATEDVPRLMALPGAEDVVFFAIMYPQIYRSSSMCRSRPSAASGDR